MGRSKHKSKVRQLKWKALVVGKGMPAEFEKALKKGPVGWTSEKSAEYPVDIILGLYREAHILKVEIGVESLMTHYTRKFQITIGRKAEESPRIEEGSSDSDDSESSKETRDEIPTYESAKECAYIEQGSISFSLRDPEDKRLEIKKQIMDKDSNIGQYLWMVVHGPHTTGVEKLPEDPVEHPTVGKNLTGAILSPEGERPVEAIGGNPDNQVHISELTIYGIPVREKVKRSSLRKRRAHSRPSRRRRSSSHSSERSGGSSLERFSLSHWTEERGFRRPRSQSPRRFYPTDPGSGRESPEAYSHAGGIDLGMPGLDLSTTKAFVSDPLEMLQVIRDLLANKRRTLLKKGREVEAQFCKRAVERMRQDERKMRELKAKLTAAEISHDRNYVGFLHNATSQICDKKRTTSVTRKTFTFCDVTSELAVDM
ncbi:hypothetical protein DdX_17198 [Ditylenchus destructor]|uniref:Uncharacterized protein n=1 Tax=Ditylenchus destructor TaxID=166010 RepID=A0AAD4MSB3_9BILA|nr:hypothetical protein DdX_17198 [Ditylenchus destructor]